AARRHRGSPRERAAYPGRAGRLSGPGRSWQSPGVMSAKFAKGERVAIVGGKQGQGMRGEVFWIGESRYGKGARYGIRGDDAETYWIDEQHVGAETDVPAPALPDPGEPLPKGTRVTITRGEAAGTLGEI